MANIFDGTFVLGNVSATTLSAGEGIKITTDEPGVIKVSNDETVLWSGTAHPNGLTAVAQLSEPITAFNEYEIHCSFESMYPYKVNKFSMPSEWNSNQPNTDIKYGGICEAVSWKPSENNAIMHAYISIGFGSNFTDLYVLSGCNVDVGKAAGSTATRNNVYGSGLYYVTKIVGLNRKQNGGN